MNKPCILWVDDEIDLLTPHILFLEQKGFQLHRCNSGADALIFCKENWVDLVLLDENMPGLSGLETLEKIKQIKASTAVVMVTNNQDDYIINNALGNQVSDFLIKPVLPNQLFVSIKKILEQKTIVEEKNAREFLSQHKHLQARIQEANSCNAFYEVYKVLVNWQTQLEQQSNDTLNEILEALQQSANKNYATYVEKHYKDWFKGVNAPVMSHQIIEKKIIPLLGTQKTMVLILDNLRLDHWESIKECFIAHYEIIQDSLVTAILPTVTQFARNAFFAGLTPLEISEQFPKLWHTDTEKGLKNEEEAYLLNQNFRQKGTEFSPVYLKINNENEAQKAVKDFNKIKQSKLSFVVYNFIDQLSHANTNNPLIKSLLPNERAYRQATLNWFKNAAIYTLISLAAAHKIQLIITTDHGSIKVKKPSLLNGNQDHTDNLRYKQGHRIQAAEKESITFNTPSEIGLPKNSLASQYIFAKEDYYLTYPNNFHKYAEFYKNSYQHGGISMEEMIIPFAVLKPK